MKKMTAAICLSVLVSGLAACAAPSTSGGTDDFPSKTITFIVPFAPGGSSDTLARTLADEINAQKLLPEKVQVVNRAGASASVGLREVAKSDPDGYTITLTGNASITIVPNLSDVGFTVDDFTPIMEATEASPVLTVRADSPYQSARQLLTAAQSKHVKVSTAGENTIGDIALQKLAESSGAQLDGVPFESDAPALAALLGRNSKAFLAATSTTVTPQVKAGSVRALLTFGEKRDPGFPDVPTAEELGLDFTTTGYAVVLAPKGTPAPIVKKLARAFTTAAKSQKFTSLATQTGFLVTAATGTPVRDKLVEESSDFAADK